MGITQDSNSKIIGSFVEESSIGVGIHDSKPEGYVDIGDSSVYSPLVIQVRSSAPTSPVLGSIYLDDGTNTTSHSISWRRWNGSAWADFGGGATPGGSDTQVQFNDGGTTLGGDSGLTYNKTTDTLTVGTNTNILGEKKHIRVTLNSPNSVYNNSRYIPLIPALDAAITVTAINVTTDSASYEVTGNLVWADTFIGKANQATVAAFTTTSGVLASTGLTGAVAATKALYLDFTASPNSALLSANIDITYRY